MEAKVTQDALGTHIDWKHESITPKMIDWFWSNMEKSFLLWHPEEHEPLTWRIPPVHENPIGAVHIAPQTWSDGTRQNLYIRFEDIRAIPDEIRSYSIYDHCIIAAGLGFGEESLQVKEVMGYRLHQWEKTDYGVVGKSSAFGITKKESPEDGMVWAKHCISEIGNWAAFLPQMYELFKPVTNVQYNPFTDLSLEGKGKDAKYKYIKL